MRPIIYFFTSTIIASLILISCSKKTETQVASPIPPAVRDTIPKGNGTDTTKSGTDTTQHTSSIEDTVVFAVPQAVVITTQSMDSVVLEFQNLLSYVRLESYTGDDVTVRFHQKGTMSVIEANTDDPIYDQLVTFSDTPPRNTTNDPFSLKDTVYTHWEVYNALIKTRLFIILVYDNFFVGSPLVIYRLDKRKPDDGEVTQEQFKTANEKNVYGILNWEIL